MRKVLSVLTLVAVFSVLVVSGVQAEGPKVIAAKFHADWCTTCKALSPSLTMLQEKFGADPVLFVKFDRTNDATINNSALLAASLGIEKHFNDYPKTGFVLLIDAESKEILAKLTKDQTMAQMASAVTSAMAGQKTEWASGGSQKGSMMKGSGKGSGYGSKGSPKGSMY